MLFHSCSRCLRVEEGMQAGSHILTVVSHTQSVEVQDRTPLETVLGSVGTHSGFRHETMVGGSRKRTWTSPDAQETRGIDHPHRVPRARSCCSVVFRTVQLTRSHSNSSEVCCEGRICLRRV
jgi:hypothetical protein